jgi:hypothetical protein
MRRRTPAAFLMVLSLANASATADEATNEGEVRSRRWSHEWHGEVGYPYVASAYLEVWNESEARSSGISMECAAGVGLLSAGVGWMDHPGVGAISVRATYARSWLDIFNVDDNVDYLGVRGRITPAEVGVYRSLDNSEWLVTVGVTLWGP